MEFSIIHVKQCFLKPSCIKCKVPILEPWLNYQEVNVSLFFCLEGFSDDPGSIFVFPALQGDAINLQNDLASFQLAAVMSRASFLSVGT